MFTYKIKTKVAICVFFITSIYFNAVYSQKGKISNDSIMNMIETAGLLFLEDDQHKVKKGVSLLSNAEQLLDKNSDSLLKIVLYRKKIEFYLINKNLEKAKTYLDKAEKIVNAKNDPLQKGCYLELLGIYLSFKNLNDESIEAYIKAEEILRKVGTITQKTDINYNLALSLNEAKQWKKSNIYCHKLMRLLNEVEDETAREYMSLLMLINYSKLKDVNNAKYYVDIVKSYIKTEKKPLSLYRLHNSLGVYYDFIKSYKKAAFYYKKATDYTLKFNSIDYEKFIKANHLKNKLESEYEKSKIIHAESELQKTQLQHNIILGIITFLLIALLVFYTFLFYKNVKYKERVNHVLKENNQKLILANKKAEKALEERSDFLRTITHELRTPINSIIGISYILGSINLNEKYNNQINILKFSGNYLLGFVNNIINLNNLNQKKAELFFEPENLKKLLHNILETYKLNKTNNNKLHYNIDSNIPDLLILDHLKTSQIIINLLNNAFKFTENGEIYLSAKLITTSKNIASISFKVKDTGIGIPKEKTEQIFLPYNQGNKNIQKKYGGSGIGLAVVKDILSLYNSRIQVESKPNQGTVFSFNIDFEISTKSQTTLNLPLDYTNKEQNKANILLVEDNKVNQVITKKIIQSFGFSCDIASNGFSAISMARNKKYDLILMDIMMPEIDGFETTIRIKKEDPNANIVALTALSETQNDSDFKNACIKHVLTKPLHPEKLYQQIIKHIEKANILELS